MSCRRRPICVGNVKDAQLTMHQNKSFDTVESADQPKFCTAASGKVYTTSRASNPPPVRIASRHSQAVDRDVPGE